MTGLGKSLVWAFLVVDVAALVALWVWARFFRWRTPRRRHWYRSRRRV